MTPPAFKYAYLEPLFRDVEDLRGEAAYRQLPAPQPTSSLATDDAPLGPYGASILIRNSFTAGVAHADALRRIVLDGEVDPSSPWTLMRGALENFATAAWLLGGKDRTERRRQSLRLWREDMRNRAQHEEDTDHVPGAGGKTGRERVQEIDDLALSLGIHDKLVKPEAGKLIAEAADGIGRDPRQITASWRAASGFAHGRYWPNLRASTVSGAVQGGPDHVLMALVIDESQHRPLTEHTHAFLQHILVRYAARATAR
ncbi:hypothetical protein AB0D94_22350 [Streptomyces sp. NPDC048255]|uniref:hypothetical protein n=1 Tax=Streptomyces sp. NPDC048255 TaxID=3154713 RepID=UPI0033CB0274